MDLNRKIGNRLRIIRKEKKRTQDKFVKDLDMLSKMSRSYYSMVEVGKRPASLSLLDMVSYKESVSYDYICGIVDSRVDVNESKYHQLLGQWSKATEAQKKILQYAVQLIKE